MPHSGETWGPREWGGVAGVGPWGGVTFSWRQGEERRNGRWNCGRADHEGVIKIKLTIYHRQHKVNGYKLKLHEFP